MKKSIILSYLGLNLKMSYQIASLFHMYIDMGERIAGKQDRFSLIIEDPLRPQKYPQIYIFLTFWPIVFLFQFPNIRVPWILCKALINNHQKGGYLGPVNHIYKGSTRI